MCIRYFHLKEIEFISLQIYFFKDNCNSILIVLFRNMYRKWNNHFLKRYTAVLVCISVVFYIMIIVVWVCKKVISFGENKRTTHIYRRQFNCFRILSSQHFFVFISQTSAGFIP